MSGRKALAATWALVFATACQGILRGELAGRDQGAAGAQADAAEAEDAMSEDAAGGAEDGGLADFDASGEDALSTDAMARRDGGLGADAEATMDAVVIDATATGRDAEAARQDAEAARQDAAQADSAQPLPDAGLRDAGPLPYSLPGAGEAVAIGTNTADDVRPAGASSTDWAYANFNSYGGGVFAPGYSRIGAYVVASAGGHGAPGNTDALIFDFETAAWSRLANLDHTPFVSPDLGSGDTSGNPWFEINGTSIPAPSHLYNSVAYIPPALGGGRRGSFVKMGNWATTYPSGAKGGGIHALDLDTGAWSRLGAGPGDILPTDDYENVSVEDESASRIYFFQQLIHRTNRIQYFDLIDGHLHDSPSMPYARDHSGHSYHVVFVDPVRRLLVQHQEGWPLRCLEINDLAAGWRDLNTTGTPPDAANRIIHDPGSGRFFTHTNDAGNVIHRLTPPSGDPLAGAWVWDTVTVRGATLPPFTDTGSNDGRRHYSTFFYIPALGVFAWISGEHSPVILLRPPG